ncbi:Transcription factor [Lachnellula subtilissima]|uniref:Transcription factor n=1 Tax=Lachnellula subtilissima TaxID=602034 RepID=A0A8H8RQJ2_9HELO|nr:Transcription factor [Lachnellula subtilissima]
METTGVDLTAGSGQLSTTLSWHEPHPHFVILFIGPDEVVFGIQKDLLCAQSPYFRDELAKEGDNKVEYVLKVPDTTVEIFGCFQNFIYTGEVYNRRGGKEMPEYTLLLGVWKLATKLQMAPLRVAVLDSMAERRQRTNMIPGIELLEAAWKETEQGSGLRKMLIEWSAEHSEYSNISFLSVHFVDLVEYARLILRSSPYVRNDFARSLPKEILSELVIVMSELPTTSAKKSVKMDPPISATTPSNQPLNHPRPIDIDGDQPRPTKRARKSESGPLTGAPDEEFEIKPVVKKQARRSEPGRRVNRRATNQTPGPKDPSEIDPETDMIYCKELISRMLSGPGFWTRLVRPFKDPVDPIAHNCPQYFNVVKHPICLREIKTKMDKGGYASSAEFEADIRLVFQNCFEYWQPQDQVFKDCEAFEKYFNDKWSMRHKWTPPSIKAEAIE